MISIISCCHTWRCWWFFIWASRGQCGVGNSLNTEGQQVHCSAFTGVNVYICCLFLCFVFVNITYLHIFDFIQYLNAFFMWLVKTHFISKSFKFTKKKKEKKKKTERQVTYRPTPPVQIIDLPRMFYDSARHTARATHSYETHPIFLPSFPAVIP